MKNRLKKMGLFALLLLFVLSTEMTLAAAEKKRIGVVSFENSSSYGGRDFGEGLADILISELMENRNYQVIERSHLNQILKEQARGASGIIDGYSAVEIGKVLGLDYLVIGNIISADVEFKNVLGIVSSKAKVVISVKMIDARTGAILFSEQAEGTKGASSVPGDGAFVSSSSKRFVSFSAYMDAARKAISDVAFKINELNPLEGVVVHVDKKKIMLDLGRNHGVREGQTYRIFREGKPIYHPTNGQLVTVETIDLGYLKITSIEADISYGQISKKESNAVIEPGDLVRRAKD